MSTVDRGPGLRQMLNKVPEVTLYFWVIKVLCTTVGETASDYLSDNVGLGLTNTTFITGGLLIATLVFQFRARKHIPGIYWLGIVLISVVGTQITDNLTDNLGLSLVISTIAFAAALALAFGTWFASERTLSIHTIFTTRREAFYWLAFLFLAAILIVVVYLSITRKDVTLPGAALEPHAQVLVVAHKTAATPALLAAIRERATSGPARFHLLVPNPAPHAELTEAERHEK